MHALEEFRKLVASNRGHELDDISGVDDDNYGECSLQYMNGPLYLYPVGGRSRYSLDSSAWNRG